MKKIAALMVAALFGHMLIAGPVSPGRALEIGRKILEGPATRGGASQVSILWDGEFEGGAAVEEPAFYVIGREGGGFVIISGNDNVRPVLAISESNRFETKDMPANVRWWMEQMKAYVRSAAFGTTEAKAQWAALQGTRADAHITGTVTDKVEHLTPEWNQGNSDSYFFGRTVFNKYCPKDAQGKLTLTGCTATALGEIMTTLSGLYPEDMPSKGTGTVGGYYVRPGYSAPKEYELNTVYDWAGLRTLTNTEAIQQAVANGQTDLLDNLAHLLADCGAIMNASYSTGGTSASALVHNGMVEHMSISKTAHTAFADGYHISKWIRMLKEDIAHRPVFYSGQTSTNAGHAFVFDGFGKYEGQDVFHVNFGWSGSGNGYYFVDHLDSGNGDYSDNTMTATFDFYPDALGKTSYRTELALSSPGFTIPESISTGDWFRFEFGRLSNSGQTDFTGELVAGVRHRDESISYFESYYGVIDGLHQGWYYSTFSLYSWIPDDFTFSFGDRIAMFYTQDEGETKVPLVIKGSGTVIGEIPLFPVAFIKTDGNLRAGDWMKLEIKNYDQFYAGTVWTITAPNGTVTTVLQAEEEFELTQSGKYKIEAAIAPEEGAEVVERLVTVVTVR